MYSLTDRLSGFQPPLALALPLAMAASATLALHSAAVAAVPGTTALGPSPAQASSHSPQPTPATQAIPTTLSKISKITKPPKPLKPFNPTKANVYAGELSIAGISLSSTEDDILWLLGPPKSREALPGSFIDEILYYGGISISLAGGQVWDIIATSPKFCTPSGVCPGDSVSRVFNTLGPTDIIGQRAVYTASGMGSCVMDLSIAYNAVSQIQLVCQ